MGEPSDLLYHATSLAGILVLMLFFFFGVWMRSYVMPTDRSPPIRKQMVAAVPVAFITMGIYAKSAFAALTVNSSTMTFDLCLMLGYAIIFGMLSRETLDRLLSGAHIGGPAAGPDRPPKGRAPVGYD